MDPLSPGVISDEEVLYRSGFTEHFNDKGKVRAKAINNKELLSHDSLSVWRAYSEGDAQAKAAEVKLRQTTPADKVLHKKFAPTAGDIRDLRADDGTRLFCVVDDVRSDRGEGKDPLHAGIRLCQSLMPLDAMDPSYVSARDYLQHLFESKARDLDYV